MDIVSREGSGTGFAELMAIASRLKKQLYFDLAKQLFDLAWRKGEPGIRPDDRLKAVQQLALCTYKNPDQPADTRLDEAMALLTEHADLARTVNQETLGLAGAIHKNKFEIDGQRIHLERSLAYYRKGYEQGIIGDEGYTALNTAFILDLLAAQEAEEAAKVSVAPAAPAARHKEATDIRRKIAQELPALIAAKLEKDQLQPGWWLLVTLAEAHFGLGEYDEAKRWFGEARRQDPEPWEFETTVRHLARIARLRSQAEGRGNDGDQGAWETVSDFLGPYARALKSIEIGKVGLALSGGGFRASLFHIGVLARLAELDVLRHVEVISCVSGGSIIGAYYYLELRKLLREKHDADIVRADYIDIVRRIEEQFLAGVQTNIRTQLASEARANIRMAFRPDYSTSWRLGELYERELYGRVKDGEERQPRYIDDLIICPKGEPPTFAPKLNNWRRTAKVPILILNATTLNTGHNWQFTASWMGEPPSTINTEIDANDRLRRMYYWQAPDSYNKFRLGHAVAASACVPGLFEPLELANLYPERTVLLVDGGVHDNQGVAGLLEQECTVCLVSDASGQMQSLKRPRSELLTVPLRANSILMARVREAEFRELEARRRASLLRGLMFVHLKKGLETKPVDWIAAAENRAGSTPQAASGGGADRGLTSYGVDKEVQARLSAIRTDLDSFSDQEAYALMLSGYLITKHELPTSVPALAAVADAPADPEDGRRWRFFSLHDPVTGLAPAKASCELMQLLDVACFSGFKIWRLSSALQALASAVGTLAVVAVILAVVRLGRSLILPIAYTSLALVLAAILLVVLYFVFPLFKLRKSMTQLLVGLGIGLCGFAVARLHLRTTDRWYLRRGAVLKTGTVGNAATAPASSAVVS